MPQRVPTVEEIQAHLAAKEAGKELDLSVPEDNVVTKVLNGLGTSADKKFIVAQALAEADIDPVQELLDHYNERYPPDHERSGEFVMSRQERVSLMKDMLQYVSPKLKAVETHKTVDKRLTVVLQSQSGSVVSAKEMDMRGKVLEVIN